jgi:hypothetical protein
MKTNLKTLLSIALFSFALNFTVLATEPNKSFLLADSPLELDSYSTTSSDVNLKLMNLQFDPLGLIFFGPQLNLDFQIADVIAVGPYFRWNYAGILYHAVITDWFSEDGGPTIGSYGIGIAGKVLPPIGSGRHRPYIEIGYEKFKGKEAYDPGGTYGKHYYEYKANVFHFGAGYRMITDESFNLSIGIFIAISKETENYDYYEFESSIDYNSLADPQVYPGIQLLLGWQFGGN